MKFHYNKHFDINERGKQVTNYGDNEIKQCCKCGRYMRFNIEYINGRPFIGWKCVCGYNEPVLKIFYSDRTIK